MDCKHPEILISDSFTFYKFSLYSLSMVTLLCTISEWYLIGADYNRSIDFNLDSDLFKNGNLGLRERTIGESVPWLKIICYSAAFVYFLTRIGILFYMIGLMRNCKINISARKELVDLSQFL